MTEVINRATQLLDDGRTLEEVLEALSNEGFEEDSIEGFKEDYQTYEYLDAKTKSTVCTLDDACRVLLEVGVAESKVEGGERIYKEKICRVEKLTYPKAGI